MPIRISGYIGSEYSTEREPHLFLLVTESDYAQLGIVIVGSNLKDYGHEKKRPKLIACVLMMVVNLCT